VCGLIYGGLLRRNADMELELDLAESIVQPHPKTYVIRLREGVIFHNGRRLTSADVRYTFKSILDPKTASPKKSAFKQVESIETPDPLTVVITLSEPFAPFLGNLTQGIVPEGSGDLTSHPVGTGPFKFVDYYRGQSLFLVRNAPYFRGAPKISGVLFKILPDETVRLLELKKGNVHIVQNPITPAVLPWLEKQEGIVVSKKTGTNVSYIGFNMEDEILGDKRVRLAIARAIDRRSIIKHMLKGLAVETNSLLAPVNRFFDGTIKQVEYNPAEAKRLLDEAGYKEKPGGKPRFKLSYKTSKNPTRKKIAEIFAQQLSEVGIEIEIKSFEWGTFFSDIKRGNFQLYSLTWVGIADPDIYYYIFHSKSVPPDGANRGHYSNSVLDGLLEEGRKEMNFEKRAETYRQVQRIIAVDMPYVYLWLSVNVAAMSDRVKGFEIYPDESLDSLARVTLKN
jgi:peptide/nickel transport system substrate-binding protein